MHNLESSALVNVVRKSKTKSPSVTLNVNDEDLAKGTMESTLLVTLLEKGAAILSKSK